MVVVKEIFSAIKADLETFFQNDPSVNSKLEIVLFSTSFKGLMLYRVYHELYKLNYKFLSMFLYYIAKRLYTMDIHPGAVIEKGIMIDHGFGVVIGSTAFVGSGTIIYHGVTLGARRIKRGKRHPTIGRNVFIGNHASILGNIKIGDFAKVGAHSVVLKNVPGRSTAVGNPARIIKRRECDDAI